MIVDGQASDMTREAAAQALPVDYHGDGTTFDAGAEPNTAPASEASVLEPLLIT